MLKKLRILRKHKLRIHEVMIHRPRLGRSPSESTKTCKEKIVSERGCVYSEKRTPGRVARGEEVFEDERRATFSQTLLNLCPIVVHGEKEVGSRSLGRSSDTTVYYGGSVTGNRSDGEGARRDEKEESDFCIHGEGRPDFGETRIGHCSLRVAISPDISVPE